MIPGGNRNKIDFYQSSPRGKMLRAMTLNDVAYWGADAFIFVIYALYVVNFIEGGSATHVGITIFIYYFTRALSSISVGKYFDTHKGYFDEFWGLTLTCFITGSVFMLLSQASLLWHVYFAMIVLGFVSAINLTSWKVLFYSNIEKKEYGQTIGVYQTTVAVAYGLAAALGGITGDLFGFDVVIFVGGLVTFVSGFSPLMVKHYFLEK